MKLSKPEVIQVFIGFFKDELALLTESAKAAHLAATHEEAKSEDKHDTRATEASYLAKGQAKRVAELEATLIEFQRYLENARPFTEPVEGALLELETDGRVSHSFFAKSAGGAQVKVSGASITVLTRSSPLGQMVAEASLNEEMEVETKNGLKTYRLKAIF